MAVAALRPPARGRPASISSNGASSSRIRCGAHVVVAQVGEQHAEGREHARRARDDDLADADLARDRDRVQRPRAAIGDQREIAGVEAALGGHALHRVGHGGRGDAQDAVGGLGHAHAERLGDARKRALGGRDVELHLAAEEAVGAEPAEHQVGVGHRRLARRRGRSRPGPAARPRSAGRRAARRPRRARSSRRRCRPRKCPSWRSAPAAPCRSRRSAPRRWSAPRPCRSRRPWRWCRPCRRRWRS